MGLEFRPRNYGAEEASAAQSLPRATTETHPLSVPSVSHHQVDIVHNEDNDFIDPLRSLDGKIELSGENLEDEGISTKAGVLSEASEQLPAKEWMSFRKILMQRFPVSKMISLTSISSTIMKSGKVNEKSSANMHLEELDDPQKFTEEGAKVVSQQDYMLRLGELKEEITRAWHSDDRVTALKLSIKAARLLMDTSVEQFYPTIFLFATDVLDLLGDFVWKRIKERAECAEDGTFVCSLPDNFHTSDIRVEAKETCNNWFFKIGSVRELLPRIYLELAILPCWCFLLDNPIDSLQRLAMMIRGVADPLASAYCRLYMVHRAQKLPQGDLGYLITCINDLKIVLMNIVSTKETRYGNLLCPLLLSLMEPTIEYIMKSIFKDSDQTQIAEILVGLGLGRNQTDLFGYCTCPSIVLHHLIKELPIGVICLYAVDIFHLIECNNDSSFDQCLNYQLLGFRLCERVSRVNEYNGLADKVIQVLALYSNLNGYLKIINAYLDIIMKMDGYLNVLLGGIFERACDKEMGDHELESLQSILLKLLSHFDKLEDILALNHFIDILDAMPGSSRNIINMHILMMATRNSRIQDPAIIRFLLEVAQALHENIDFSNIRSDENQQAARLVSRFIYMVDYGPKIEENLAFLVECRGVLGGFSELKETFVHLSNLLAIKAMRDGNTHISFVKSCLAYSEVTIPSVRVRKRQLNLYLETAEVALLGGLVSHSDGLIDSAICCLENIDRTDGLQSSNDLDVITSSLCKLCSLMIIVPGDLEQGVIYVPKRILSFLNSESRVSPRLKIRVLCALILFLAASCQNLLPYRAIHGEILGNHLLFFSDPTYLQECRSLADIIVKNIVAVVLEEPSQAARGHLALEACNCIASSFIANDETSAIFSELMDTAKSCLSVKDKYLMSTVKFLDTFRSSSRLDEQKE